MASKRRTTLKRLEARLNERNDDLEFILGNLIEAIGKLTKAITTRLPVWADDSEEKPPLKPERPN